MPFSEPVTVTFCAVLTVAVVAAKVALLWLSGNGHVGRNGQRCAAAAQRDDRALVAALFNAAVQVLDALLPSDEGEQDTEESCAGALPVRVKV